MTTQLNDQVEAIHSAQELTQSMLAIVHPNAIFGQPVQGGEQTILTASEVAAAMGVGTVKMASGGGGTSSGRPVAIVTADADGVRVRPVLDVTKILVALLATVGSLLVLRRTVQSRRSG